MVAFSKDFSLVLSTEDSDVHAERIHGNFAGLTVSHGQKSQMVTGENRRLSYDSCLSSSLAQGSEPIDPFADNHLTAEELKTLSEEMKRVLRVGLGDTVTDGDERGGMFELNGRSGELENYHGQTPRVYGGREYVFSESPFRRFFRQLFGWRRAAMWHTHPSNNSHSPQDYRALQQTQIPSIVVTQEAIYIANPGAYKAEHLISIPTSEALW